MQPLKYLQGYPTHLTEQVQQLIDNDTLKTLLLKRYPTPHNIKTEKALYDYVVELKNAYLKKSAPISKVAYDNKINVINHALGLHTFISRVHGSKLKAKHEIRIASVFKSAPLEFLRMIVVHELAHLREKEHNKAFYALCCHMEPCYHQLEFDMRMYLTQLELLGPIYTQPKNN
ncbi:metal-dependent hydrolase [Photobacterium angustum]|uniref:M48 metallopeptidase family protein n=1 Tax=Photobacterium angustum TaxID=661 RepID=UPI0005E0C8CB|nr:M48 family metallopeptidase [Photobacterium angustum]KJF93937.1 metal-dependent hydrolase [Photobacterium angustum]KJG02200.1 metal-dependent hydrolase [Photobacterium angustum]KJG05112.1 metal-dependent hydrolase [Photobacterium angustum]PSV67016.1 M48 family peptidase [Photobacterium angustum]PSV94420.1 M48 family peptidase [Photobacterium angustum]